MLKSWKLKEAVLMSLFAVVFGIVYLLFVHVSNIWAAVIGPLAYEWMFGIWFIVSIICMYIIRKPGAAFLSETMAATIEVLIGNAVGPRLILSGVIQGLGAEAVFALTRYQHFNILVLMLAGIGSAVFSFVYGYFVSGYAALDPSFVALMFTIRVLSGAIIAGIGGKYIGDALLATGSLRGYAIARAKKGDVNA
ncbi:energy-coupling factor transport system substrate-specific component [Planomicrobium stackebrandtii]|uniref:Energy-coupling factor transport system substrate-specific component n=1 Tax=Planomicrobium stackebrandtii TaxID=253160 RepID=A0ABU0GQ06_9BACL|nr:ECF transporter S component [Planomicrobium stackebrandtii]MDQ0427445.1 energy-coupling factor transport system substrate-specific component [Planomicrobium stackebrandtii]